MVQKKHLLTLLKLLFVAALMFIVLSQISYRDGYEIRSKENTVEKQEYGRIVGAWDAPVVAFLP